MTIQIRPRAPWPPWLLRDLADDLERLTGEQVEVIEVRAFGAIEIIDIVLEHVDEAFLAVQAFVEWRRRIRQERQEKKPRRLVGVIYGPTGEILREVPDEGD